MVIVFFISIACLIALYFLVSYLITGDYKVSVYSDSDNYQNGKFVDNKFGDYKRGNDNFSLKNLFLSRFKDKNFARIVPLVAKFSVENTVEEGMKITHIGHATHLIQINGVNILVDPVFSDTVGFGVFSKKRLADPAFTIGQLPNIDYVFISHNHYDHMDKKSILQLDHAHAPVFLTFLGNEQILQNDFGVKNEVRAFDWYEKFSLKKNHKSTGVVLEFLPSLHYSHRFGYGKDKTLWGSLAIYSSNGAIYYAGDTEFDKNFFNHIREHLGYIEVAILPVKPVSATVTNNSLGQMELEEIVKAIKILEPSKCLTMQCGVFQFNNDAPYSEFLKTFGDLSKNHDFRTELVLQKIGSETSIKHTQ